MSEDEDMLSRIPSFPSRALFSTSILLLSLLAGGCESWGGPPVKVDLSTPKSAALAYLKAVQAGDRRAARAACVGTPEQLQWVDGRVALVDGMRKFDNALYAKFGNITSQVHTDMHDTLLKLADVWVTAIGEGTVSADDNKARIDPARNGFFTHFATSVYLLHEKEGWKVDIAHTYAEGGHQEDYAQISAGNKQWREFGAVFAGVAQDIRGGKFRSADAASQALVGRLQTLRKSESG